MVLLYSLLLSGLCLPMLLLAAERNVTIDDQLGDEDSRIVPVYTPYGTWTTQTCTRCAIKPDTFQMFDNTFTAATFMPDMNISFNSIDFTFNGTAIYIFFTLFNFQGHHVAVNTECNFTIDGQHAGYYNHTGEPERRYEWDYRVPVFRKTDLEQRPHHMNISVSGVDHHVYLNFDYAIYTLSEADSPPVTPQLSEPPPSVGIVNNMGVIVGGVIGGLGILAGFMILCWLHRRHRRPRKNNAVIAQKDISDPVPIYIDVPRPPSPRPLKPRPVPISPPQSFHCGSTVITDSESPQISPTFPTPFADYLAQPGANQSVGHSKNSRVSTRLAEEVWKLREELTWLKRSVVNRQLKAPRTAETFPTYAIP